MENNFSYAPVSVVIPCFNAYYFLERAVDSVINQTLLPMQLVLVDDASTDNGKTRNLIVNIENNIRSLNSKISVKTIFLSRNGGPGCARNIGWDAANQNWIAFLDADDAWHPRKIALQYDILLNNISIDLLAHKSAFIQTNDIKDMELQINKPMKLVNISLGMLLISNKLPTRSVILRRSIPLRFPENNNLAEDYSLWLDIVASGFDVRLMKFVMAYTFRPEYSLGGYSGQLWIHEKRELATLRRLYHRRDIHAIVLIFSMALSLLKFIKRVLVRSFFHVF